MYSVNNRNQLMLTRSAGSYPDVIPGSWFLGPDHMLRFRIQNSSEEIIFKTTFVSANAYKLVFSVTLNEPNGAQSIRLFQFEGEWQADESNRLTFVLAHHETDRERLVFEGHWNVGRNHEIIYRYTSEELKAGRQKTNTIILKGTWQIFEKDSLTFLVEGSSDSNFRFRAEFIGYKISKGNLCGLEFRIGIQTSDSLESSFHKITISGRLKVRGPLELGFEIAYEKGRIEEIKLLAECEIGAKGMLDLALFNSQKEGLGIQIEVYAKIFGDRSDLFLRARATENEKAVEGGVKVEW